MIDRNEILTYLRERYQPVSVLLYGSYAAGNQDEYSDFDCMLIVENKPCKHDDTVVGGVQLDCFLFTPREVREEAPDAFLTAYDAEIVQDDGTGAELKQRVRQYVEEHSEIGMEEKRFIASWIRKTLKRTRKQDDEGSWRAMAVMWESLADYCLLRDRFYFGSKNTIRYLRENDPEGYALFHEAVTLRSDDAIERWAEHVIAPVV